jgi:hypothetical protein
LEGIEELQASLNPMSPQDAKLAFIKRYNELQKDQV